MKLYVLTLMVTGETTLGIYGSPCGGEDIFQRQEQHVGQERAGRLHL
jgi:hypothetical protein